MIWCIQSIFRPPLKIDLDLNIICDSSKMEYTGRQCRVCGAPYTLPKWVHMNDGSGRVMRTCCKKPNYTLVEMKEQEEGGNGENKTSSWSPPKMRKSE